MIIFRRELFPRDRVLDGKWGDFSDQEPIVVKDRDSAPVSIPLTVMEDRILGASMKAGLRQLEQVVKMEKLQLDHILPT